MYPVRNYRQKYSNIISPFTCYAPAQVCTVAIEANEESEQQLEINTLRNLMTPLFTELEAAICPLKIYGNFRHNTATTWRNKVSEILKVCLQHACYITKKFLEIPLYTSFPHSPHTRHSLFTCHSPFTRHSPFDEKIVCLQDI